MGEPEKFSDNPHWSSGPPASLYSVKRVEAWVEANKERVEAARDSGVRRSAAGTAVQERKRIERHRKAQEWADTVRIEVASFPATLTEDARRRHSNLTEKGFRAHVRHRLTNYESLLRQADR